MKSLISVVAVIGLLTTGTIAAQSASSSKSSRENDTTMQLNQEQLQSNAQQAATPPEDAPTPMPQPQAGTVINGKFVPAGARCGNDNPSCAQQIGNPAVNSATQLRLQGAQ